MNVNLPVTCGGQHRGLVALGNQSAKDMCWFTRVRNTNLIHWVMSAESMAEEYKL